MSNRQEKRRERMNMRLTRVFGKDLHIQWRDKQKASLQWEYSLKENTPTIHVDFIGTNYEVKCEAYNFHWKGSRLIDAASQLKLLKALVN